MTTQLPVLEPRLDMRAPDVTDAVAAAALLVDPIRASILRTKQIRETPAPH